MVATPATVKGVYRLVHRDSNDNTIAELLEKHSSEFGDGAAAEDDAQKMPKVKKPLSTIMKEDDKFVLMVKTDETYTVGALATANIRNYRIPVTFRNRRSGVVYEKTLVPNDIKDLKPAVSGDKYTTGVWYDIEEYAVPAQSEMKLGHALQDVRVDSAINIHRRYETAAT